MYSQSVSISDSEDLNFRNDDFSVIGLYQNDIVCFLQKEKEVKLLFYSSSMQKKKEIKLSFLPNRFSNLHFYTNNKELIVLYEVSESKSLKLYASKLQNSSDLTWQEPIVLSKKPLGNYKDNFSYSISASNNNEVFLAHTIYFDEGSVQLQAVTFDINLKITQSINQSFKDGEMNYPIASAISNKGNCFILTGEKISNKEIYEQLKLLELRPFANEFTSFSINTEKNTFSDLQLNVDNKNQILYISSFFHQSKYASPKGFFLTTFDIDNRAFSTSRFTRIAIQNSISNSDLKELSIRKMLIKENGNVTIITEKYYQTSRIINSINPMMGTSFMMANDNSRRVTEYNYEEINLFNFKNDGSLVWSQNVLKDQFTSDDGGIYSSFFCFEYPLGQVIIFNDLSSRVTRLLAAYTTKDGKVSMKQIQTNEEIDEWNIMPRSAKQISKSTMVIPCIMKNRLCFLKLNF